MLNRELDDLEEKLRFIHETIDNLFREETTPKPPSFDNITEEIDNVVSRGEYGAFLRKPDLTPKLPSPFERRPRLPKPPSVKEETFVPTVQTELPFLICENFDRVEELLLNPSFSAVSLNRIEEISTSDFLTFESKMFSFSESKQILKPRREKATKAIDELLKERKEKVEEVPTPPDKEVVEEKKGFGWKGLGTRLIVYDKKLKEYKYVVREPELTEEEEKIKNELIKLFKLLADVPVFDVDEKEKQKILEESLDQIIKDNGIKIPEESKDKIFYYIMRDFVGYGKIDIPMRDGEIEDISCDGYSVPIFVHHRKYQSIETNIRFKDGEELDSFVVRLAQICGKQISVYSPIVDGKLPDGSRLQATLSKTVTRESTFTVRRFREDPLTPVDLIENNTMSLEMAAYFWLAIEHGASILFCGGTASGKTTTLNALSLFIPPSHKIISIEDTREVNLPHKNWIAGTTREGFSTAETEKTGKDIDMFDLLRAALRQRPRVIIVGEVRGREAYALFQAMATGHTSYATIHAGSIHTLIQRLENPPISLPRALLTSLDIIVFINAIPVGGKLIRRITSVTEIIKMDPDTKQLIFMQPFRWRSKVDDRFECTGSSKVLMDIRLVNDWDEKRLQEEIKNRIKVLEWMVKNKVRSYKEVGAIIAEYYKDPKSVLKNPGAVLKRLKKEEEKRGEKKEEETEMTEEKSFLDIFKFRRKKK